MPKRAAKARTRGPGPPPPTSRAGEPAAAPSKAAEAAAEPSPARPPRPTKAQVQAERYPNLERFPALQRALTILHQLQQGKARADAEAAADRKVGPRAPLWQSRQVRRKPVRGKRPEPERRVRVKSQARRRKPSA